MQVYLTFDYELFFGSTPGTVEKCMLEPTRFLLDLCRKYRIGMTFFVDVGYLLKLEEYASDCPELANDLAEIKDQIAEMRTCGCAVQLHIHPHWEKSTYTNGKWEIITDGCYKLDDFPQDEVAEIVKRYHAYLLNLTGQPVHTYRAGGWCIQPFEKVREVFKELGICADSSVFPGGQFQSPHYDFDFTSVPRFSDAYRFETNVCEAVTNGSFTEFPIASWKYSPLFYWQLYVRGRLNPGQHKMIGDGSFLAQPGRKRSVLTHFTWNHVSCDGFYARMLGTQAAFYASKNTQHFTVIGHPKGLTRYAMEQLDRFIRENQNKYTFSTFSESTCN